MAQGYRLKAKEKKTPGLANYLTIDHGSFKKTRHPKKQQQNA